LLIIRKSDIEKAITMSDAIKAIRRGFATFSKGRAIVPLRIPISIEKNTVLFMPGALTDEKKVGIKVVSVYPQNIESNLPLIHAAILLIDGEKGIPKALIEGGYVTAIRTGAAGGVAADLLARKDAEVAFVFGAGVQGRSQLEALCAVRNIKLAYVYDIDSTKAKIYETEMKEKLGIEVRFVKNYERFIPEADIIVTATPSREPFLKGELLKEGVHINAIGSHTTDMSELDTSVFKRASIIAVDSKEAVLKEAGEVINAIKASVIREKDLIEIGEIINDPSKSRKHEREITIFKTVGIAIEDVVVGELIYEKAKEKSVGIEIKDFF